VEGSFTAFLRSLCSSFPSPTNDHFLVGGGFLACDHYWKQPKIYKIKMVNFLVTQEIQILTPLEMDMSLLFVSLRNQQWGVCHAGKEWENNGHTSSQKATTQNKVKPKILIFLSFKSLRIFKFYC
jgi:hypothetical protein